MKYVILQVLPRTECSSTDYRYSLRYDSILSCKCWIAPKNKIELNYYKFDIKKNPKVFLCLYGLLELNQRLLTMTIIMSS